MLGRHALEAVMMMVAVVAVSRCVRRREMRGSAGMHSG